MVRSMLTRRTPRILAVVAVSVLAVFTTPLLNITSAEAAGQTIGGFEIDGNTTVESAQDWNALAVGDVATGLDNTSVSGQDQSTFQGSSHEYSGGGTWDGWSFGGGN